MESFINLIHPTHTHACGCNNDLLSPAGWATMSLLGYAGVIYAVAKKDCGGEQELKDSIMNGDIKVAQNEQGQTLYFFPKAFPAEPEK